MTQQAAHAARSTQHAARNMFHINEHLGAVFQLSLT